jgi:hypothetical protein
MTEGVYLTTDGAEETRSVTGSMSVTALPLAAARTTAARASGESSPAMTMSFCELSAMKRSWSGRERSAAWLAMRYS